MKKKNMKVLSVCSLASLVISGSVISTTGVKAADTNTTTRLGGSDRYETAVKISQNGWKSGSDYVVLANGQGFADALCANPIARSKDAPILLTESNSLNSSTLAELKRLNAKHVIVVGGTGVVPTAIENTIKTQLNADVTRYGGADRYETSVKIAKALGNTSKIVLASGRDFADALSAGPSASIEGIPVVLTQPDQLPSVTSDYIKGNTNLTKTYVIGGTGSVSASLYNTLKNPERFGGIDRFETNAKVIDGFKDDFDFNNIYVALGKGPIGNEFADSLTGGALASKNKNPLVITSSPISSYTTGILKDKLTTSSTLTILGGTGNITDTMISTLKDAITTSPSTGGGGGGGNTNITTSLKSGDSYTNTVDRINNKDLKNSYFKIADNDADNPDTINVQLLKNDNTLQDIFKSGQGYISNGSADEAKINTKVENFNEKLQNVYDSSNLTVNGANLKEILKNSGSKYIDSENGTLKADSVIAEINKKESQNPDYAIDDFINDLTNKVTYYLEGHPSKTDAVILKVSGYEVSSIQKDGTSLYNSTDDAQTVATTLIDMLKDENSITGNYTINIPGNSFIKVNIAAPTGN
ncbi:cell wall-binding repeat-containing protein [Clostridium tyrobutyricum]|uniref:cell wall-binding repeat-containing protein n=1 Tax=Clostridium tyrobutyricum TaxID=1519 RepID=UPI001C38B9F9|nr:cell wall-binding repeat-containing protein [Clostridium tyrobutyricum]MBV4417240.1 cell wall-binding repeat-containing protein [Clostridium tyrobutyricum]